MGKRLGEKAGWLGGWAGAFIWVLPRQARRLTYPYSFFISHAMFWPKTCIVWMPS
jgi:hypothetical protein